MASPTARLHSGKPLFAPHTPAVAVVGGDVVLVGQVPMIAVNDIPANERGDLAVHGGLYTLPKSLATDSAIAAGESVYWDFVLKVASNNSFGNELFGYAVTSSGDNDFDVLVLHNPNAGIAPSVTIGDGWRFDDGLVGEPQNKRMGFNNAAAALTTNLRFNKTTNNGLDAEAILLALPVGKQVYLQDKTDATKAHLFTVWNPPTDHTNYVDVDVQWEAGNNEFADNDHVVVIFL